MKASRIIIYAKDVQLITGRSDRYAYSILAAIRSKLGKQKHQLVTIQEFCEHMALPETEVRQFID